MGRNAKPISLLKQTGKKHLTKAEIKHREKSEINIGNSKLTPPEFVKNDVVAFAKWKELTKLFKDFDYVSSGDVGMIARYSKTFSEYQRLLGQRDNYFELDDVVKYETLLNKKQDMLIKMEDRLFLNPLAKVKNVPKKEEPPKADPVKQKFGGL